VIVHILKLGFKEDTSATDVNACLEALRRIGEMDSVVFGVVGQCMGPQEQDYSHAFAFAVKDLDSFREEYMKDPVHREGDFIIHPHVEKLAVFDISDDMSPVLEDEIRDVQEKRIASDPELAALLGAIPDSSITD
jgi:hypothetical protein